MKKLLTVLVMCFAVFAAKAQVTVILEAHDVWGDQSGYQLLLDADATAYGTIIPTSGALNSSGDVDAATYAEFEYKIPENADGALTTTNMVYDGSVTITIPAGTYDFCVTNPTPGARMWIAAGENGRQDDYVFQDGYTYHFTVARNGDNDGVTIDVINNAIATAPTAFTATPAADHSLSVDLSWTNPTITCGGTALTAITSVVLTRDGETIQTFNTPTVGGTMTFTDNTMTADGAYEYAVYAVTDAGNGLAATLRTNVGNVCEYRMELTDSYGDGWNGASIEVYTDANTLIGSYTIESGSSNTTVLLPLPMGTYSFVWVSGNYDSECSFVIYDPFNVPIYSSNGTPAAGTLLTYENTCTPQDPFLVFEGTTGSYSVMVGGTSEAQEVIVTSLGLTSNISVAASAMFEVSTDGSTYDTTGTITADENYNAAPLYIRFVPTAAGVQEGTVIITSGELADTLEVSGEGVECNTINTFPYQTDFSDETMNLCWTIEDANNDNKTFTLVPSSSYAQYSWNSSSAADDWLISPVMALTGNEYVRFDYKTGSSWDEKFEVAIIQGSTRTIIVPEMTVRTSSYLTLDPVVLSAYTGEYQIGIHCTSAADMFRLYITNFVVDDIANLDATLTVNPEAVNFGSNIYTEGMTINRTVTVNAIMVHNLTASVEAPFSVSLDGTTFAASVELPDEDPIANNTTLYVQYAPAAAGSHTGTLNITNGETTATVALSGSAADCSANIGALPFTEDFEGGVFPPTCWSLVSNNTVTWTSNVNQNDNSTWAYCNYSETAQDEKLITKTIDFTTSETTVTMTFDFEASHTFVTSDDPAEQYNLLIYASTDDGATFSTTPLYDMRNDQGEFENWTITSASVDLSSLIGQTTVKLMFNYYGTYGAEMWVDNISIFEGTVGIEEETAENAVAIYPNPATTMLNVHAENFDNVQVINFLGQVVYSANVTENDFQINVSNLSNGVYFIRLNGENTVTKKFVKK